MVILEKKIKFNLNKPENYELTGNMWRYNWLQIFNF